jgi:hypothetical protein
MFKNYSRHLTYFSAAIIFFVVATCAVVSYKYELPAKMRVLASSSVNPSGPKIKRDTVIREETKYLCGDLVNNRVPTTSGYIGLNFKELQNKYPPEKGWQIDDTKPNQLVISQYQPRVCLYHQDYRHLGINQGVLVVYEGPLGYDQKVLQREEIGIESLPPDLQIRLSEIAEYQNQTPDVQGSLKEEFEFANEAQLNEAMENFDEYRN